MKRLQDSSADADYAMTKANVVAFPAGGAKSQERPRKGVSLTKASVKKLTMPAGKNNHIFWDPELPGFGLRLQGAKRTWVVQFRDGQGVSRRLTVGTAAVLDVGEARQRARRMLATRENPVKAKREAKAAARAAAKVGELTELFLAYTQTRQKPHKAQTHRLAVRNLRVHAAPLHGMAVKDVRRGDVAELHERLTVSSGPAAANRALGSLSSFFVWTIGKGYRDDNPAAFVPKNGERARERTLSDAEIRAIWKVTGGAEAGAGGEGAGMAMYDRIVRLLLLTGCRRGEVGGMRWEEFGSGSIGDVWLVPAERMKGGRPHLVPLTGLAIEQLPERKEVERAARERGAAGGGEFVFGRGGGNGFQGWAKAKTRLDARLAAAGWSGDDWSLHDFRRTISTRLHEAMVEPHIVEAVLAHVGHKQGVAGIYNQATYLEPKRAALELWERMITEIVGIAGE